jgi:hypothetical protein
MFRPQLALPGYAQVLVVWVDALPLDLSRPRQLFFNHSTSIFHAVTWLVWMPNWLAR